MSPEQPKMSRWMQALSSVAASRPGSWFFLNVANPIDAGKNFTNPNNYSPGGPGDIVMVRLFYQWPIIVTKFGYDLSNLNGSKRLLSATAAFQNEPF